MADLAASPDAAMRAQLECPAVRKLLAGIADHSQGLWSLIESDRERLVRTLAADPDVRLTDILDGLSAARDANEADVMRRLRQCRRAITLVIALADLGGVWDLAGVMEAQTKGADALIAAALGFLLRTAQGPWPAPDDAEHLGIVLLGVGRLGGGELGYANDAEIIALFDPDRWGATHRDDAKASCIKIVRDLVRLLQHPTDDGTVMRVDLRLRPEPNGRAVAISRAAALDYYETYGQNWERAALTRVRVVAGDAVLGARIIDELRPFVWRTSLDTAAIADVYAMKRQVRPALKGEPVSVLGHDINLARGGLRDIEVFTLTQQLVFCAGFAQERGAATLSGLRQLARAHHISEAAARDLAQAYALQHGTLHRLQLFSGPQTDRLPLAPEALERFVRFDGYESRAAFTRDFASSVASVIGHYDNLFAAAPSLGHPTGNLVFAGPTDDQDTLDTLGRLGFRSPETVAQTVRTWHSGARAAVRSSGAREALTELVPRLLTAFAETLEPDAAVAGFDRLLDRLPVGDAFLGAMAAMTEFRTTLANVLGSAPRLAQLVTTQPHLLDVLLRPIGEISTDEAAIERGLAAFCDPAATTEAFLDAARDFRHAADLRIGAKQLAGDLDADTAGHAYSAHATGLIRAALDRARTDLEADHGSIDGASSTVLAFGALGAREMTATSDLDLVLVYEAESARLSTGHKPLHASAYFARLTQRLVSYLTVPTRHGRLYAVDMRLRPSGNRGPLATTLSAFGAYQRTTARPWEHLALTRASVVAGHRGLGSRIESTIRTVLSASPHRSLREDIATIRARIEATTQGPEPWASILGGLAEIELFVQALVVSHAPSLCSSNGTPAPDVLRAAATHGRLDATTSEGLIAAHRLFFGAAHYVDLAALDTRDSVDPSLTRRLAVALGYGPLGRLQSKLTRARRDVARALDTLD